MVTGSCGYVARLHLIAKWAHMKNWVIAGLILYIFSSTEEAK